MDNWAEYQKQLKKQRIDKTAIRENNSNLWLESYPFEVTEEVKKLPVLIKKFITDEENNTLLINSINEFNAFGYLLIKQGYATFSDILVIDYPWLSTHLYDFESKELIEIQDKLYSGNYKYIFFKDYLTCIGKNNILLDKRSIAAAKSVFAQIDRFDNIKIVFNILNKESIPLYKDVLIDKTKNIKIGEYDEKN